MSTERTYTNRKRTLLILLGIILAFLLTLNAKSFYSADSFTPKETKTINSSRGLNGKIDHASMTLLNVFVEKFTSLK